MECAVKNYVVLYREDGMPPLDPPLQFHCQADDYDHAEEQCQNAYPDGYVVWVWGGSRGQDALDDYWLAWRQWGDINERETDLQSMRENQKG